jgi:raffinose/stachyose/melibiose transport system substrate-binding protein
MKKWLFRPVIVAVLFGLVLAQGETVTLRLFSYMDADAQAKWPAVIDEFKAANPNIDIKIETLPGSGAAQYPDVLRTSMATGDPQDLFWMWGGTQAGPFIRANQVADLTPYYKEYGWEKTLAPWALGQVTRDGKRYGVPRAIFGMGFFIRKDILEKFKLKLPTTFAGLEAMCDALVKNGVTCISVGGKYGWHTMRITDYLLETFCGPAKHDALNALTAKWNDACVVQAYTALKRWVDRKYLPQDFLGADPISGAPVNVYRGRAAMILEGGWFDDVLKGAQQDRALYEFWVPPTGHTPVRFSTFAEYLMVSKSTKHLDEAAKFIDFVSQASVQKKHLDIFSTVSATAGVNPDCTDYRLSCRIRELVSKAASTYPPTDQAFEKELMDAFFAVQDGIVAGKVTPANGAAQMEAAAVKWKASGKK